MTKKTWKCSICGYANDKEDEICQGCGSLREESAYDIETDLED